LDKEHINQLKNILSTPRKVVVTTHKSPDGDAMGSSLALYHYLLKKGHDVQVITPDDYPEFLHWLPGNDHVKNFYKQKKETSLITTGAEVIFCLDFNSIDRLWEYAPVVQASQATKIVIDHHRDPEDFADYSFVDISASSTSQMIYEFIEELGDRKLIDKTISDCLYTGIVTDTGSFKFSSTSPKTHRIAAEIMAAGSDTTAIHNLIYDNSSEDRLRLLGFALSSKLIVYPQYNAAIISLTKEELSKFNYKTGDTEGIVNYPLSIKGIVMAVLITEKNGEARLSLRSKGNFPVNEMARKYFHGGGHMNAAGGIDQLPVSSVIEKIENILPLYEGELF
jgi:phosphoesterase RecJ-like protein